MKNQKKDKKKYAITGYIPAMMTIYVEANKAEEAEEMVIDMSTKELLENVQDYGYFELLEIYCDEDEN
jgi:hypothetical protein